MITLEPATPQFYCCPWCRKGGLPAADGDNLSLRTALPQDQREPNGFYASAHWGECHFCEGKFFGVTLTMIAGSIEETQHQGGFWNYLWLNEQTERIGEYDAVGNNLRWSVAIDKTPKGPMLQHDFGPFAMRDGFTEFLRKMIIDLWPDLRALANNTSEAA